MAESDYKYNSRSDMAFYRFVDDVLILCNKEDLDVIKSDIVEEMDDLNLTVHPFEHNSSKSSFGTIGLDRFQYLGYEFFNNTVSVREASLDNFYDSIIEIFKTTRDEDELYYNLNHKITGCVYHNKKYGWLNFFALIDDIPLLHKLDAFVKKSFKQHNITYSENKVKKFVKTYFELKNIEKSSYIPKYPAPKKTNVIKFSKKRLEMLIEKLKKDMEFY